MNGHNSCTSHTSTGFISHYRISNSCKGWILIAVIMTLVYLVICNGEKRGLFVAVQLIPLPSSFRDATCGSSVESPTKNPEDNPFGICNFIHGDNSYGTVRYAVTLQST